MKKFSKHKTRKGFTLIEMVIVLFIISLLILIMVPNLSKQRNHAQTVHTHAMTSVVQSQIDSYFSDHSNAKTVNFDDLQNGGYLSSKQIKQSKEEGVKIVENVAKD